MQDISFISELKELNILIGKKMFEIAKIENVNHSPSPLQFRILDCLLNSKEGAICQRDLEKNLNVSKATISGVLFTMEKNGIIDRFSSEVDARSKDIKLTDKSLERFNEMKNVSKKIDEKLIQNIRKQDLDTFLFVLDSMKKNLDCD